VKILRDCKLRVFVCYCLINLLFKEQKELQNQHNMKKQLMEITQNIMQNMDQGLEGMEQILQNSL